VLTAAALFATAGVASAQPQPTIGQVRQRLAQLMSQEDQAGAAYDQALQQLASARRQVAVVNAQVRRDRAQFETMRGKIAQLAAAAYENGSMTSAGALLTADNPQTVISQAAMIQQLSSTRSAELRQFIDAARQVMTAQRTARRDEAAVAALERQRLAQKKNISKAVNAEQALLNQLTGAAQTLAAGGGVTFGTYTGPTNTPGEKAVAFAYGQLGKPYVWGATGPHAFDCSGLVQWAYAQEGISLPHYSYSDETVGSAVSGLAEAQPGDIVVMLGGEHVGLYAGKNSSGQYMILHAPYPGAYVRLESIDTIGSVTAVRRM
jgi:cell wall-associated NlpC family hydrolase